MVTSNGYIDVSQTADLVIQFNLTQQSIAKLINITQKRRDFKLHNDKLVDSLKVDDGESAGGELDQIFDEQFEKVLAEFEMISQLVETNTNSDINLVKKWGIGVNILIGVVCLLVAVAMFRSQRKNEIAFESHANKMKEDEKKMIVLTQFADEIGSGNYDIIINEEQLKEDSLAMTLTKMKDKLKLVAEEDNRRNWANEGLAEMATLLRTNFDEPKELFFNIIKYIVNYLEVNQGGLFLINDDDETSVYVEMVASLAYNKRKFIEKKDHWENGLIGRCILEAEIIYMSELPDKYMLVTSGLGEATAGYLILVPLKVNQEVYGVLELASFKPIETYQIEFLKRIAESIASTLSSVKMNIQTKQLLEQSIQQTEEMKSQEEEMRQNMEELSATQEEMARKENDYLARIKELEEKLGDR